MSNGVANVDVAAALLKPEALEEARKLSDEMRRRMSEPGKLDLPPLLEAARWQYAIPDSAFQEQAIYDRVHVWQLSQFEGQETFGDTSILMPDISKTKALHSNPRGVLLSAGPAAMDALASNGVDLGHLVTFINMAIFRTVQEMVDGKDVNMMVLGASDITSSKTLQDELRRGDKRIQLEDFQGRTYHTVVNREGVPWCGRALNPRSIEEG
jgi:hypothetical protein